MAGNWHKLTNKPGFNISTMILLSDGRVMVQEEATEHWHALTPDQHGSYIHGTWSPLADMAFWRRYYASGMLKDGRIILIGGEQSGAGGDTNQGQIYDPVTDSWSPMPLPPWATVGDATCCILPNGDLMIGALTTTDCLIFNPVTNSWNPAANKAIRSNEETWVLLPDDTIVTAQCFPPFHSERYSISSNAWKNEGAIPASIVDPVMSEIGPAMLMYNSKVIYFGAANVGGHGKTAIYTPPAVYTGTGAWAAGPNIPKIGGQTIVCNDCPAALLPNGKVLAACAPFRNNDWGSPISFIEYDPFGNTLLQAPTPGNNNAQLFWSRFMLLPTGGVLFSPSTDEVECYIPDGFPQDAWRPVISSVSHHHSPSGSYYFLKGLQLNGLSQGNLYGDDCNPATNYPLVRLRDPKTHHVFYARTYHFSTRAVSTPNAPQSVRFDASHIPYGHYELCVVANGISSHCIHFGHHHPHRPCGCHVCRCQEECRCEKCKPDPCCCEEAHGMDPELAELHEEVRSLRRATHRLASIARVEEAHQARKDRHKDEDHDAKKVRKGKK